MGGSLRNKTTSECIGNIASDTFLKEVHKGIYVPIVLPVCINPFHSHGFQALDVVVIGYHGHSGM